MDLIFLAIGVLAFIHGIRDVLQYYGMKNFLTTFLQFYGSKRGEIMSAIASFSISILFFWISLT